MSGSEGAGSAWWEPSGEPPPTSTPAEWYYSTTGVSSGPVSLEELRRLVTSGQIRSDHHVRHAGWDTWWSVADSAAIIGVDVAPPRPTSSRIDIAHVGQQVPGIEYQVPGASAGESTTSIAGEVATFGQRLTSWLVDGAVLTAVLVLANNAFASGPAWSTLFVVAVYIGYTFGLRHLGHDTLGHLLVGLRVRDASTGAPPSWLALATRSSIVVLLALPLLIGLAGSVIGAFAHPRTIAWHDVTSGTVVIKVPAHQP